MASSPDRPTSSKYLAKCCLSVVGLSGTLETGVGKSSLCARFVRPGENLYKDHGEDHNSVIGAIDFHGPEINNEHFLFHGRVDLPYPTDETELRIHVVEHTTFIDESTMAPFRGSKGYVQRAIVDKLKSPGKTLYEYRSGLGAAKACAMAFSDEFVKTGIEAFMFVMDPTAQVEHKQKQLDLLLEFAKKMPKKKTLVILLSKCDALPHDVQQKLRIGFDLAQFFSASSEVKGKSKNKHGSVLADIPVFFTSAKERVNVDEAFCYASHIASSTRGLPCKPKSYLEMKEEKDKRVRQARLAVMDLLRRDQSMVKFTDKWVYKEKQLMPFQCFQNLRYEAGVGSCNEVFRMRLVEVGMAEKLDEYRKLAETDIENETEPLSHSTAVRKELCMHVDLRLYLKKETEFLAAIARNNAIIPQCSKRRLVLLDDTSGPPAMGLPFSQRSGSNVRGSSPSVPASLGALPPTPPPNAGSIKRDRLPSASSPARSLNVQIHGYSAADEDSDIDAPPVPIKSYGADESPTSKAAGVPRSASNMSWVDQPMYAEPDVQPSMVRSASMCSSASQADPVWDSLPAGVNTTEPKGPKLSSSARPSKSPGPYQLPLLLTGVYEEVTPAVPAMQVRRGTGSGSGRSSGTQLNTANKANDARKTSTGLPQAAQVPPLLQGNADYDDVVVQPRSVGTTSSSSGAVADPVYDSVECAGSLAPSSIASDSVSSGSTQISAFSPTDIYEDVQLDQDVMVDISTIPPPELDAPCDEAGFSDEDFPAPPMDLPPPPPELMDDGEFGEDDTKAGAGSLLQADYPPPAPAADPTSTRPPQPLPPDAADQPHVMSVVAPGALSYEDVRSGEAPLSFSPNGDHAIIAAPQVRGSPSAQGRRQYSYEDADNLRPTALFAAKLARDANQHGASEQPQPLREGYELPAFPGDDATNNAPLPSTGFSASDYLLPDCHADIPAPAPTELTAYQSTYADANAARPTEMFAQKLAQDAKGSSRIEGMPREGYEDPVPLRQVSSAVSPMKYESPISPGFGQSKEFTYALPDDPCPTVTANDLAADVENLEKLLESKDAFNAMLASASPQLARKHGDMEQYAYGCVSVKTDAEEQSLPLTQVPAPPASSKRPYHVLPQSVRSSSAALPAVSASISRVVKQGSTDAPASDLANTKAGKSPVKPGLGPGTKPKPPKTERPAATLPTSKNNAVMANNTGNASNALAPRPHAAKKIVTSVTNNTDDSPKAPHTGRPSSQDKPTPALPVRQGSATGPPAGSDNEGTNNAGQRSSSWWETPPSTPETTQRSQRPAQPTSRPNLSSVQQQHSLDSAIGRVKGLTPVAIPPRQLVNQTSVDRSSGSRRASYEPIALPGQDTVSGPTSITFGAIAAGAGNTSMYPSAPRSLPPNPVENAKPAIRKRSASNVHKT